MHREKWNAIAMVMAVVVLAVGGPWLIRQMRSLPRTEALAARADQRIVTLEVGGMTCAGCAANVRANLTQLPGVSEVEVRYAQRRAYVVCDRGVADTTLIETVHRSGPGFLAAVASR